MHITHISQVSLSSPPQQRDHSSRFFLFPSKQLALVTRYPAAMSMQRNDAYEGSLSTNESPERLEFPSDKQHRARSDSAVLEIVLSNHYLRKLSYEDCGVERPYGYYEGSYPAELGLLLGIRAVSHRINELILSSICSNAREVRDHLIDFVVEVEKTATGIAADRPRARRSFLVRTTAETPPDKLCLAEELLTALWDRPTFAALRESSTWDPKYDRSFMLDLLLGHTFFEWQQLRLNLRLRETNLGEGLRELRAEGIDREVERRTSMSSPACATALKALLLAATTHRGGDFSALKWMTSDSALYVEASPPNLPRRAEELRTKRWHIPIAGTGEWLTVETFESSFAKASR